ncbi:MAG TPA: cytochrome c3 family protein [Pyrinomonadaceae bacterium]|nr:cytochrome c3 family protein [Pyrinomonadaceae bacterium]
MKLFITLAAVALGFVALSASHLSPAAANLALRESKKQPEHVVLNKSPKTTKSPDKEVVPFNHVTHSTKNYSADMKSVPSCAECHHTDQPKAALTNNLVTSERDVVLTTALLEKPDSKPVKGCAQCHSQAGTKPASWPEIVTFTRANGDEVELTNENAYHINCIECHESVKKVKAATTAPIKCAECHNGKTTSGS